ncbi:MAG: hypothetical protein HY897_25850, partial [Deltaproteobacteria bacterium]|nr:hypothetical protein [Deltaproteobacteria bacterium]
MNPLARTFRSPRAGRRSGIVALCLLLLSPSPLLADPGRPAEAKGAWPEVQPSKKRPKGLSVAIFQLETHGTDKRVAAILTDTIVSQVSRIPDAEVIGSKEIDAMLNYEQKKQMAGCDDTSCAVALGGALGVDKILMG